MGSSFVLGVGFLFHSVLGLGVNQTGVLFLEFMKRFLITVWVLAFSDHIFEFYRERINQLTAVKL